MAEGVRICALTIFICANVILLCYSQVLTPPTFNLAKGRKITASSTCGVGVSTKELYCRLTGSSGDDDADKEIMIQGQLCDYCDPSDPNKNHSAENAIDGTLRFWQSPPLSRDVEYNKVTLEIELEQEFLIAYVYIKMANSPRPGVWALEKSDDYGKTWEPWQYFADNEFDCERFFNTKAERVATRDNQVLCVTDFSKIVPLKDGEIFISLTNNRPNSNNFTYADDLKDFIKATNVRMRLLRTNTLKGQLMAKVNQDVTVTRRYFYSIRDISIGGRCVCNGHSDTCNYLDLQQPNRLICNCRHNTVGDQCERCDADNGFVQKKWQPRRHNSAFECEPCQCYGRATTCVYDADVDAKGLSIDIHGFYKGGGVCQNCGYNTSGINCEKCLPGYYRPYGVPLTRLYMCERCQCDPQFHIEECEEETGRCLCREEYTGYYCDSCAVGYYGYPNCIPCDCDVNGTEGDVCHVNGGQCPCKENFVGKKCDMCQIGFYDFPTCGLCECDMIGSVDDFCNVDSGQCNCRMNYGSRNCSQCAHGYFNFPDCTLCSCDPVGAVEEICDKTSGDCLCKETFNGDRCDECARGYYAYPDCMACQCQEPGSTSNFCEDRTGQCTCKPNYAGQNCERCAAGFYKYPECISCQCDSYGSYGQTCDQVTGQCDCRYNFQGLQCEKCKQGLYNYPNCEVCNCNPEGAKEVPGFPLGGCGEVTLGMLCECKERVTGRICDMCKPGYWNLNRNNPLGCEGCGCFDAGTIAGVNLCDMITGQCMCKVSVTGRACDRCKDGYYGLHKHNLFGCTECNCDIGGSVSPVCNRETGQCVCKPRVEGRRCNQPIRQHFIPSLDQMKYELEDGYTPEGTHVRYGYDERIFPNFSWRGYAILMNVQPEVRLDIDIDKPSLYRMFYRYVNRNEQTVKGEIMLEPDSILEIPQTSMVDFAPSMDPAFAKVGKTGGLPSFVLNPGKWTIVTKTDESVFLDYLILIPQAYFEATVLQNTVYRPCVVPDDKGPCIHYGYPDVLDFPRVLGETGYIVDGDEKRPVELVANQDILDELNINSMAILNPTQNSFSLDLYIPRKDKYVLILNYYTNANGTQTVLFHVGNEPATAVLYNCQYSSVCRQVLLGLDEMEGIFDLEEGYIRINVTGDADINAAIESIVAIPYSVWSIRYIRPSIVCIKINGVCVGSRHATPVGSVRIDFETLPNDHLITDVYPPGIDTDDTIGLVRLNSTVNLIVLLGTARTPGPHKFVVHYYLPYDIGQEIPVTLLANGQEYKGVFKPSFCPGIHGCRDMIFFDETGQTGNINLINTDVQVVFNNTSGQEIWLDYLLMIPSGQYSPQDVNILPVDNSRNFIQTCLDEGFKIKQPISDFCEKSLFTLTTEFNNGALECECNVDGSLNFLCEPYGGRCQCKPNVIGRTCSACKVGYFGFPRCQPCNCPFGLCHQLTGQCICPPRVTGDRCDVCKPGTYGYDALIGCQECQCNPQGVVNKDINCDENTGQCRCLPGIGGRRCDMCLAGFYAFPSCRECDCDRYGTTAAICNAQNAQCICKENVNGPRCDECQPFTYNLEQTNPAGCTNCFCFGNTANCQESNLKWDILMDMQGWGATNAVADAVREAGTIVAILDAMEKIKNNNYSLYWTAPDSYLGNKITSYGGYLHYNVLFVLPRNESIETRALVEPDLILVGNHNKTIVHTSVKQPYDSTVTNMEVQLYEYNFEHPATGEKVSREDFMMILVNLEAMHIRASYYSVVQEVRLMEVELDVASDSGPGEDASSVEMCACPKGYTGTSCESCAKGFYRGRQYPFLGICVPCQCHGHTDTCDLYTGECLGCGDNTIGAHCEMCKPGYYGEPTRGGACYICGCPLQVESNNFADQCSVSSTGSVGRCACFEGYIGDRCERCAPGYYGNPLVEGETCKPCQCSNNIDMRDPESCDSETGECIQCINNSTGPFCEKCLDWWYGDAVEEKDCRECSCDQCGSLSCNSQYGQCTCKPNVIGMDCDECAPDTYGFESLGCKGCMPCECADAAVYTQCDAVNGSCVCQPGTTGLKCESCEPGYWNYKETGCQLCDCEFDGAVTCDPIDGKCQCLAGVTGAMCEQCLDRWVLIPRQGCQECDTCTHHLLDDMDMLDADITDVQDGLQTVSIGVEAMRRLDVLNKTVADLSPQVISVLYESENITLEPVEAELKQLDDVTNNVNSRTRTTISDSEDLMLEAKMLKDNSVEAEKLGTMCQNEAKDAILHINEVLRQINEGIKVTNIETYITLSEQIIVEMRSRNFTGDNETIGEEMMMAKQVLEQIRGYRQEPNEQISYHKQIVEDLVKINGRLKDLEDQSERSQGVSTQALNLIDSLRDETIKSIDMHIEDINAAEQMTLDTIKASKDLLDASDVNLDTAGKEFSNLDRLSTQVLQARAAMLQFNGIFEGGVGQAAELVNASFTHADELLAQATLLENVYMDTREVASNAVTAGRAYENIVKAIDDAKLAADKALDAADSAATDSQGVGEASKNLITSSEDLLMEARTKFNQTQTDLLDRLDSAKAGTSNVKDMNSDVRQAENNIKTRIARIPVGAAGVKAGVVVGKGEMAEKKAKDSRAKVKDILQELPYHLERTIPLTNDALNTNRDISQANVQVKNVEKFIPDIKTLLTDLTAQSEKVQNLRREVTTSIAALKEKIAIARNQANLIRVGLDFLGNTTVTLRNPPNVEQAGSYSQVSLFFKTSSENGLLLYAGSERSATNKGNQGDYMALEIENGNVVFKYDLGSGEAKISHPHYAADGHWYKVIAKRIGKGGMLTLDHGDPNKTPLGMISGRSEGLATVLEMNPLTTRFYAGGLPSGASISDKVTRDNYEGVMESIEFDDQPMGLWNFKDAENNLVGARERNILTSVVSNGFRFDGSGYVILSTSQTGWKPAVKSQVSMKFKTYAENGLLFFAGDNNRDFLSIELNEGEVVYQFDLGGGRAQLRYPVKVNDGEWHDVQVNRLNRTGYLYVDKDGFGPVESPGTLNQLSITDDISIGGYQDIILPISDITKQGFDGCIQDVSLELGMWDLNENKKSKGVIPGCPEQVARVATFSADRLSYLTHPIDSIGANFDITFKVKTKQKKALLVYVGHTEQTAGFSVSLLNGKISVISDPGDEKLDMMSRVNTYNDGRWHYISIMKIGKNMQMNIDDYETIQTTGTGEKKSLVTNTPLYFGNAPVPPPARLAAATDQLDGCIGDVTINGQFLNFAAVQPVQRPGTSLSGCPIPDPEGPYDRPAIPTSGPWIDFTTESITMAPTLPPGSCALDVRDPVVLGDDEQRGYYFGAYPNSRLEYESLPSSFRIRSILSMEFKTTHPDGIIFYFADAKHTDNIGVVMTGGKIYYTFNSGTGSGEIITKKTYNDGAWHKLTVGRNMKEGVIMVDREEIGPVESPGRARSINGRPPYYFGGINPIELEGGADKNLAGVTTGFVGCIANIMLNQEDVGEAPVQNGTQPCSDLTENGAYFYGDGGYIKLVDSFSVGLDLTINMEIRPRSLSGVIFSVHGSKGDYIILQLVEGELWFTADNGAGPIVATLVPEMNNKLCDGAWHKVSAVKNKNVVVLTVDDREPITTTSSGTATSTDTSNPIYLGGKPDDITKGVRAKDDYKGCMRNLVVNGEQQYLATGVIFNDVSVEACPAS